MSSQPKPSRVTMRDLADEVGVSSMTVSRALRGDKTVSDTTRARVEEAAKSLGYVYDITAQAFRTKKSGFVAVTLPSLNNANLAETYGALSDGTDRQLLLGATNYGLEREEEAVRQLLTRNPEALILTGGHHTPETRALIEGRGLPVIEIWDLPPDPLGHCVGFSNADAMGGLVAHLAHAGHVHLAFIGASEGTDLRGAERRAGAEAAAKAMGLPPITYLDAGPAPISMRHSAALMEQMGAAEVTKFDALVCVADPVAFGALTGCQRLGLTVPDDIAIAGFGNFEIASICAPRLTTVDVDAHGIGFETARLLRSVLEAEVAPQRIDVGSRVVVGETA